LESIQSRSAEMLTVSGLLDRTQRPQVS
jgi:hypothetical protein